MRSTQVILRIIAWQIMSLQVGKAATQLTEGSSVVIHNMISKTDVGSPANSTSFTTVRYPGIRMSQAVIVKQGTSRLRHAQM